jgi:hypothetical protein
MYPQFQVGHLVRQTRFFHLEKKIFEMKFLFFILSFSIGSSFARPQNEGEFYSFDFLILIFYVTLLLVQIIPHFQGTKNLMKHNKL